jgi:hypothetical protein
MVRLVGNDTMEEINAYFDYENNFPQLLEDYITKSGEVEELFQKSKDNNRSHFNRVMKYQLKKLNEQNLDEDPPRIKLFKTWMSNKYEQKKMKYHKKDNDLEKDELIRNLKNELMQKNETIIQLENENKYYSRKIKKLRKQLNLDKPKPKPAPVPEPEPSPELLKMMDPDYDSDDDIVEKPPPAPRPKPEPKEEPKEELPSIYSNHLTSQEEKEKDEYEQQIKAQCEEVAREKEEHIRLKEEQFKLQDKFMEGVFKYNFDKHMKDIVYEYEEEGEITVEEAVALCEVILIKYLKEEYDKISHNPLIDYPELEKKSKRQLIYWAEDALSYSNWKLT